MRLRPSVLLAGVCTASLAGWGPLRTLEQLPAPLAVPFSALAERCEPEPTAADEALDAARRDHAAAAWSAWSSALLDRPAPDADDVGLVLAPVVSYDAARRELVVRAPDVALAVEAPVTHRGVLLGFLRPWGKDGTPVVSDGLAKVALLGHRLARPVAAEWSLSAEATPVHFLVEGGAGTAGPRLGPSDRELQPPPGQLAWTRDVRRLGDGLPPGLLLGTLARERDLPGGGVDDRPGAGTTRLLPLLDPGALLYVALEAPAGSELGCRRVAGRLASRPLRGRVAIDRGLVDGVRVGDVVAQDGRLVGRVESVGPFTALARVGEAPGPLLLLDEGDRLLPLPRTRGEWPDGAAPRVGQEAYVAHRALGGLFAGVVSEVDDAGLRLDPPDFAAGLVIEVVEP